MAVYKVIQDIEADDKLLGPLTLKQFIFAVMVVGLGFFGFLLGRINPILALPMLPPMIVFGFLAAPLGREQPNEIWLAARIRFFLKPKVRIWDQTGIKELVTITAPKRVAHNLTNNLSQGEVRSRLAALADTLDSRGWAIKTANVNAYAQPAFNAVDNSSDRLISAPSMQQLPTSDVNARDDILDPDNNPIAQHFDQMIQTATQEHRQQAITQMQQVASGQPPSNQPQGQDSYWYPKPGQQGMQAPTEAEAALLRNAQRGPQAATAHLKKIQPLHGTSMPPQPQPGPVAQPAPFAGGAAAEPVSTMTASPPPAILELANNDNFSVATLAQQAKRVQGNTPDDGEVVVSLH